MKFRFENMILEKVNILMLFLNKLMNLKLKKKSKTLKPLLKGKEQGKKEPLKIHKHLEMNLNGLDNFSIGWA